MSIKSQKIMIGVVTGYCKIKSFEPFAVFYLSIPPKYKGLAIPTNPITAGIHYGRGYINNLTGGR
jgi:hypothetical protein